MIIKKEELVSLIHEAVDRQDAKQELELKIKDIENEIQELDNSSVLLKEFQEAPGLANAQQPVQQMNQVPQNQTEEESESIFDVRLGETIVFRFQDLTIKAQRLLNDTFMITDSHESQQLKKGDIITIKGNDILKKGMKFRFGIYRQIDHEYESRPLIGWQIIKNR